MSDMLIGLLVVSIIVLVMCLIAFYLTGKIFKDFDKQRDSYDEGSILIRNNANSKTITYTSEPFIAVECGECHVQIEIKKGESFNRPCDCGSYIFGVTKKDKK